MAAPVLMGYPVETPDTDSRIVQVEKFFRSYRSPLAAYASDFLAAADTHHLDWRLLPSLAIIESGGKAHANNNVFGWANGRYSFPNVRDSIHHLADMLNNGVVYRNKDLEGKLRTYNPRNLRYGAFVLSVMNQLGPEGPMNQLGPEGPKDQLGPKAPRIN